MMRVSIFYSNNYWVQPLNEHGLRQHVFALYQEIFRDYKINIYPKRRIGGTLAAGLHHTLLVWSAQVAVLCPGYPVVSGALASFFMRKRSFIVHTWKVPGFSDHHFTARLHDILLRRVIWSARAVVVASLLQKRQLERQGVDCPVLFAPVSVDSSFWQPNPPEFDKILSKFGLNRNEYVLTVGGSDRDETYAARVAKALNLRYVRSTYSPEWAKHARVALAAEHLEDNALILVNPTRTELRSLYAGAALLCLPTKTDTNPAGLSSLVEGLACGVLVAIPSSIAAGYVEDGVNGLVLDSDSTLFAARMVSMKSSWSSIREKARLFALKKLTNKVVASELQGKLFVFKCF